MDTHPSRHMSLTHRWGWKDTAKITENHCAAFKEFTDLENEAIINICYRDSYTNREIAICHIMSDLWIVVRGVGGHQGWLGFHVDTKPNLTWADNARCQWRSIVEIALFWAMLYRPSFYGLFTHRRGSIGSQSWCNIRLCNGINRGFSVIIQIAIKLLEIALDNGQ